MKVFIMLGLIVLSLFGNNIKDVPKNQNANQNNQNASQNHQNANQNQTANDKKIEKIDMTNWRTIKEITNVIGDTKFFLTYGQWRIIYDTTPKKFTGSEILDSGSLIVHLKNPKTSKLIINTFGKDKNVCQFELPGKYYLHIICTQNYRMLIQEKTVK